MKRIFYLSALFAVTLVGFSACDEEDEEENKKVDFREQAVGTYDATINFYIADGKEWDNSGMPEVKHSGIIASIDGNNIKLKLDEGEYLNLVKIAEASNGFTFDVEDCSYDGYTFIGFNGYELISKNDGKSTKFNGGFFSDKKTMEFYMECSKEQFSEMLSDSFTNDSEFMKPFLELAEIDPTTAMDIAAEIDEIISKISLIAKFTLTKK